MYMPQVGFKPGSASLRIGVNHINHLDHSPTTSNEHGTYNCPLWWTTKTDIFNKKKKKKKKDIFNKDNMDNLTEGQ